MTRVITFGEIMLRLKSPGFDRLFQSPFLEATFGGGEANVAVSLANYGLDAAFVTCLPDNDIGRACLRELRKFGVDTSLIQFGPGRMGIYFLESGANQRPSKVIYDRDNSAVALAKPDQFDWEKIFAGAHWFHISGITPAISQNAAENAIRSVKTARELGLKVSCDLNYRSKLWRYGKSAPEVMREIVQYVDVCIANEEDIQKSLGMEIDVSVETGELDLDKYRELAGRLLETYANVELVAITLRRSINANQNHWSACACNRDKFLHSTEYAISDIVDRVGGGDSFAAGLIFGLNRYPALEEALEFAIAASCLKHSINGDFNLVSISEVEQLMKGNRSGRVQR
ncbi:MAG: sugar kinase [Firmicutes bacterium]|nr:sugar kinase [Bacillota bacterium]HPU01913.1 sugar kinase [Bacillota bacterium]